jgi:hypothetical protein
MREVTLDAATLKARAAMRCGGKEEIYFVLIRCLRIGRHAVTMRVRVIRGAPSVGYDHTAGATFVSRP